MEQELQQMRQSSPEPGATEGRVSTAVEQRAVRVCLMIDTLCVGGTETRLMSLIRDFDRTRVEPFLCLLDGHDPVSQALEPDCCPVLRLGVNSLHRPRALRQAWRFRRFLREHRIDVLQVCFPDSTYFGALVARLAGVPQVIGARFNQNYWMTTANRWLGRLYNRFLIAGTITNCEASRQAVIADERPRPESVVVIDNGVDVTRFARAAQSTAMRLPKANRRVGIVATLRPVKNFDVFLEAARIVLQSHPDAVFEIAGDGELRSDVERLIGELRLGDRVKLLGNVDDIPDFLTGLDVAVLCSSSEGHSNSLLEYMAAGRAIVATAVGGNVELIENETSGLLVPAGDPLPLANAISRLLADSQLASRLGQTALTNVQARFDWQSMVRRYEDYYLSLVVPRRLHFE